ncbi:MAG: DUF3106 domain-containing protein [Burkholderiales bacterium]|nr:DUF3106 domain-containing protein [Burkholderiales bacterium]
MNAVFVSAQLILLSALVLTSAETSRAQELRTQTAPPITVTGKGALNVQGPSFSSLSANQKTVLAPLEPFWEEMAEVRRKKWMEIANRFPSMPEEEQGRVKVRMQEWASLSPAQRKLVRENFVDSQKVSKSQKQTQWEEYQKLSDEEKRTLLENLPKKQVKTPENTGPVGAAATTRANAKTSSVKPNATETAVK